MSATGSTFKDWNADEAGGARAASGRRRALLVDDDFSWSDPPPARSRRAEAMPAPRARVASAPRAAAPDSRAATAPRSRAATAPRVAGRPAAWDEPLDLEHELDDAWGGRLSAAAETQVSDWDESTLAPVPDGPRTVVITGHGAERQVPMGRRRRQSELRIHERAGFNPDRIGMWAFVLGIALVLGAIIH